MTCNLPGRDTDSERGGNLVEYALLLALLVMVAVAAVMGFSRATMGQFSIISSATAVIDASN
ncbi:MAG: hypothetical protein K1X83_10390 [Oligoflexia bacterium]|nr:hypothetical protein [Oligoflexia bacterium]